MKNEIPNELQKCQKIYNLLNLQPKKIIIILLIDIISKLVACNSWKWKEAPLPLITSLPY